MVRLAGWIDWCLIALGLILLFWVLPHGVTGDGVGRFNALAALLEEGRVVDSAYSLLMPLLSSPFYLLGKIWMSPQWWLARFNTIVFALFLVVAWKGLRPWLAPPTIRAFILLLISGSMFTFHLQDFYGEVVTACVFASGSIWLTRRPLTAGLAIGVAVANTPAVLLALVMSLGRYVVQSRRLRYLLIVVLAVALVMVEWWVKRGSPFNSGYGSNQGLVTIMPFSGRPGFSYPLFFGVLSTLLSFGKGLLFFAPGLVLVFRKDLGRSLGRAEPVLGLWLWFLLGLILVYARWWAWYGGFFWGPRFYLFAGILSALVLAVELSNEDKTLAGRLAVLALLGLSLWVGVTGAVYGQSHLEVCHQNNYALEHLCWYVPEFSVLWRPLITGLDLNPGQASFLIYALVVFVRLAWPEIRGLARGLGSDQVANVRGFLDRGSWRW